MADSKITELTELTTVESSDLIAVVDDPSGSPITKKATVSNITASKAPLASPTFTGTVTLPKTVEIQDTSADHQYVLAVSELTADRTVTLPLLTGNDEVVFKDHTQTLTNKTLTSPKINEDVALTSTATELNALHSQTGAWTSYTVTPTNLTIGSGTLTGRYIKIGKLVIGRVRCVLAADSSISGAVEFSKPVTSVSASFPTVIGECVLLDYGTVEEMGRLLDSSTTKFKVQALTTPGTYVGITELSATSPWTWAVNDIIDCKFIYEAA